MGDDVTADDIDTYFADDTETDTDKDTDTDASDRDDRVSDLSAAILGSKAQNDGELNTNGNEADMQYYVKVTLINMWLILGLIVVVNICFYWCYCRKTQRQNKRRGIKNNMLSATGGDSSDAVGGVSEEDDMA